MGFNICDVDGELVKKGSSPIDGCLYFNDDNMDEYTRVKTLFAGVRHDFLKIVDGVIVEKTQAEKDVILAAEAQAVIDAQNSTDDALSVTQLEVWTAWVQLYNSKVPAQYQVTKSEIIQKIKDNR